MRVGLCIPIGDRGAELRTTPYSFMRDLAMTAEHGGLESIWVADHLFIEGASGQNRGVWESMSILGALADATSRVELGPLVLCAPFRNPGVVAWAANTLEEISGGRFVLGMGAGWHKPEFDAFDFEWGKRVSFFEDSLEVIVPLLRSGRVDYDGEHASGHTGIHPRQQRAGGPPILLAGTKPRMMSLIAKWADRWNSVWYGLPTDVFREERADLMSACAAIGRDPSTIQISVGVQVMDPRTLDSNTDDGLVGTVDHIAEALRAWHAEGVAEVMCRMEPPSVEVVEVIADAAIRFRQTAEKDFEAEAEAALS